MSLRTWLSMCVCVGSLVGCGHPIRDLVHEVKDLVPDDEKEASAPTCPGQATTRIELIANLHAGSPATTWDPSRPEATSSFVVSGAPFTSDGRAVDVRIFFASRGDDHWSWHVLANQRSAGQELGSGQLHFDGEGALIEANVTAPLRLPLPDGSLSAPISVGVGSAKSADQDGFGGVTSTDEPSRLDSYEQDGLGNGSCS
ncbi:MAG TPA: hypothetical protein VFZ61_23570 [Polyangiales bacterium]